MKKHQYDVDSFCSTFRRIIQTLKDFKEKRYIDVRETPAKRSGAYNMGVYGVPSICAIKSS